MWGAFLWDFPCWALVWDCSQSFWLGKYGKRRALLRLRPAVHSPQAILAIILHWNDKQERRGNPSRQKETLRWNLGSMLMVVFYFINLFAWNCLFIKPKLIPVNTELLAIT
jgi:hypothetical protein